MGLLKKNLILFVPLALVVVVGVTATGLFLNNKLPRIMPAAVSNTVAGNNVVTAIQPVQSVLQATVTIDQEDGNVVARLSNGSVIAQDKDAATAINKAISGMLFNYCDKGKNYCADYAGAIHIAKGEYNLAQPIKIPDRVWGLLLEGEGQATILTASPNINAIEIGTFNAAVSSRNIDVRDLTLNGINGQASNNVGILNNSVRTHINNVVVRWFGTGVMLQGGGESRVMDSTIEFCGVGMAVTANDCMLTETVISDSLREGLLLSNMGGLLADKMHLWGNDVGIKISDSKANIFTGLEVADNKNQAVVLYASANGDVNINKFDNCYFWRDNKDKKATGFVEIMAEKGKAVWNTIIQNSIFYDTENTNTSAIYQWPGQGGGTVADGNQYFGFAKGKETNLK